MYLALITASTGNKYKLVYCKKTKIIYESPHGAVNLARVGKNRDHYNKTFSSLDAFKQFCRFLYVREIIFDFCLCI